MPLGSSSAAPAMRPGPSCFSRGSRTARFPAREAAASFSSFAVMAAVRERRAARRCGSVLRKPDRSLNEPDDSNSSRLAQVLRQYVIGIAFPELGEFTLDLGHLALGPELANILEPFFRRALPGFGNRETVRDCSGDARSLERGCGLRKRARCRGSRGRLHRSGPLTKLRRALSVGHGSGQSRLRLLALAQDLRRARNPRHECRLPRAEASPRNGALGRTPFYWIALEGLRDRPSRRDGLQHQGGCPWLVGTLPLRRRDFRRPIRSPRLG